MAADERQMNTVSSTGWGRSIPRSADRQLTGLLRGKRNMSRYDNDPEATRHHEPAWRVLTTLANRVLGQEHQSLR